MGIVSDNSMFIKLQEYKEALETMNFIKKKVSDAKQSLDKLNELKKEEEAEMAIWRSLIADVESKLGVIDQTLVEIGKK